MSNLAVTNDLFFDRTGMDIGRVEKLVGEALSGMDDGELFLEYSPSESVASASFDTTQGFGLRAVAGEATGYAHASELSEAAIRRAASAVKAVAHGYAGTLADPPLGTNRTLYTELNPLGIVHLTAKTKLLTEIEDRGEETVVRALVWVEAESQKGILIGSGGRMIKAFGTAARKDASVSAASPGPVM